LIWEELVNNNIFDFREITIPGDVLADDNISDGAKLLYGKIARLSYKTGFCWASNKFFDGTETGSTAKRQIKELKDAGYIKAVDAEGQRRLHVCEVNSKVNNQIENEKPPIPTPKPEPIQENITIKSKEDATTIFNYAREYWNERKLKPECRDIMMRPADTSEILRTMQHYTWEEIKNAIGNYAWHKYKAGSEYTDPPPYGSLAGFLKTGVERYFDDKALDPQFKKETVNARRR